MKYILNLYCQDKIGIVAKVSNFLADNGGFILESAQFGDSETGKFFMRTCFEISKNEKTLEKDFTPIAKEFGMNFTFTDTEKKPNILILTSQYGHCLNDILYRNQNNSLKANIVGVISNHKNLKNLTKCYNTPFHYYPINGNKKKQEAKIEKFIDKNKIDLVILARYMQILSSELAEKLKGKAINIHHSFLPSFKGAKPYHQAHKRGVKIIGATAHYITKDLDEGPIIEQEITRTNHTNTIEDLITIGHDIEAKTLNKAVKYHIENRILLNGNKTVVFK